MIIAFSTFALSLFIIGFGFLILPKLDRDKEIWRFILISAVTVLWGRYIIWRFVETTYPAHFWTPKGCFIWFCFFVELLTFVETFIFFLTMLKHTDRRPQADMYEKALRSLPPENLPSVDIYIPSYNEPIEVLERSILGALHIDWPKDKICVWVLDDGKRDWLQEYCAKVGAGYIRRKDWIHAKAGNLNHASEVTNGDFIVVFDADFVPFRRFLWRTIGFFSDPKVAIVQTPQHFFNKDFVQLNLHLHDAVPDEQRLFFDMMMPARDGWDAAFWCGSCSVTRRTAMKETGGVPTHSITEDLLTTLVLLRHGYVTRYLNEKLSHGLSPESMEGLITQRKRWCRGTIQTLFWKDGPLGPGLRFVQRLIFFPIHWLISPFTRLFAFFVPLIFLWTGVPALLLHDWTTLIYYHFPAFLLSTMVTLWLVPQHYIPILSSAISSLESIQIAPTVIHSLFFPYAKAFGVTPKGKESQPKRKGFLHPFSFWVSSLLLAASILGILVNMTASYSTPMEGGFFPVSVFWAFSNVFTLFLMVLLSVEHPHWRDDERFDAKIFVKGRSKAIPEFDIFIKDISTKCMGVTIDSSVAIRSGEHVVISLPEVGDLEGELVRLETGHLLIKFHEMSEKFRHRLIKHIYTGQYENSRPLKYGSFLKRLWLRITANHHDIYHREEK